MMMEIAQIPLASIDVGDDRARSFSIETAQGLAQSVQTQGLMHPIRVLPVGDRYLLISGRHRLEAFRINEAETIPATVSGAASPEAAKIEEISENIVRGELIALDRCHHLYDLKQAWEKLHPETKKGGNKNVIKGQKATKGQTLAFGDDTTPIMGFTKAAAEKLGLSPAAIKLAVKIWTEIVPTVRARLVGMAIADKQTELKALSELTAPRQVKVIDLIQSEDHPEITNIAAALAFLDGGVQPTAIERTLQALRDGFKALPDPSFDRIVAENADRMIASLQRLGRI